MLLFAKSKKRERLYMSHVECVVDVPVNMISKSNPHHLDRNPTNKKRLFDDLKKPFWFYLGLLTGFIVAAVATAVATVSTPAVAVMF